MRKPKYNYNDKVKFTFEGKEVEGTIYIVNANGTWENPEEVSYDIMGIRNGIETLFKHIPEHLVF